MAVRTSEEAAALRDQVLDLWAVGHLVPEIAADLGLTANYVGVILHKHRRAGDPRAAFRASEYGRSIYVPLARAAAPPRHEPGDPARRELVLDAWAAGIEAPAIAAALGMRKGTVTMIASRAREKGDARAGRRQHDARDGLSESYLKMLGRLRRHYGVDFTIPEIHP